MKWTPLNERPEDQERMERARKEREDAIARSRAQSGAAAAAPAPAPSHGWPTLPGLPVPAPAVPQGGMRFGRKGKKKIVAEFETGFITADEMYVAFGQFVRDMTGAA